MRSDAKLDHHEKQRSLVTESWNDMQTNGNHAGRETKRLALFMTRRMSLAKWQRIGILDREMALYRRLHANGIKVSVVSYGGREEREFAEAFPWITLCYNRWNLPRKIYETGIPWLHRQTLRHCNWIKTNQSEGALAACHTARTWRVPLIARSGFCWSQTLARSSTAIDRKVRLAQREERSAFTRADRIVVTTDALRSHIVQQSSWLADKIRIIPNYVDTRCFAPDPSAETPFDLVYVGRLSEEKNIDLLLHIVRQQRLRLLVVGGAGCDASWKRKLDDCGPLVQWEPCVAHESIPGWLRKARAFILLSNGEGHPKALLEALACGLPAIATRVTGIQNLVSHDASAFLCEINQTSVTRAIQAVLSDPQRMRRLGSIGRELVERNFALDYIVEQELQMLSEMPPRAKPSTRRDLPTDPALVHMQAGEAA